MSYISLLRRSYRRNMKIVWKPEVVMDFDAEKAKRVMAMVDPLMLTGDQMAKVMETLNTEMWLGLSRHPEQRKKTSLQMENTYVRSLLNGKEEGDFLALDLGGTNFRVLLCQMRDGQCESISKNYNIPQPKLHGPSEEVFEHLAESIHMFLKEENMLHTKLPLGFTFSFPMIQESLKKGILITWTKTFACPDGVGEDAVAMLETALARRGDTQVDVVAVLNDTTGTLLAGSYLDKQCQIGLIMGTGCNAAYLERLENVDKWSGEIDEPKQVVIDIEWGAFGDNGSLDFIKTEFDKEIDLHSNWVGSFTFEKLFAGHYLGDLVRLVLVKLVKEGLLFEGKGVSKLFNLGAFTANHVSQIERDSKDDTSNAETILNDLGLSDVISEDDITIIRYLCSAVSIRGAQLISSAISVLLNHMKQSQMTVAIDGSLYRYHPHLHDMMTSWIAHLAPNTQCKLILAKDGSGRGAAFVAAVAVRMQRDKHSNDL